MSNKYPGGLVTLNPPAQDPALGAATNGVWTMDQALNAETNRSWAMYDPYYNNVVLNLHGNGTNGAQNNTFLDSSSNNFTITRNGNTTQGAFNPYRQNGYWGNYFPGTSGSDFTIADSSQFEFTGDFTIEAFVYPTALGTYNAIIAHWQPGTAAGCSFVVSINSSNRLVFAYGIGGSVASDVIGTSTTVATNTWSHVCVSRNSGTIRLFVNGVQDATTRSASGTLSNSPNAIFVGSNTGADLYTGYISNLRVLGGTGVTSVTVPTSPLTAITNTIFLTCQSNRFVDNSSNAFPVTYSGPAVSVQAFNPLLQNLPYESSRLGGSGYFDGSGDYLSIANSTNLDLGSSDFTIEGWWYPTSNANQNLIAKWWTGGSQWVLQWRNAGYFRFAWNSSSTADYTTTLPLNAWCHFAIVRSGSNLNFYFNGVKNGATGTIGTLTSTTDVCTIGQFNNSGTEYTSGNLTDIRVTKGGALYTATFTPPTAPLTTIVASGTVQLLTSMTNAGIYDNAMMNDLETVGNAQISTSVKKYGTGSMAFDGSGDYLFVPATQYPGAFGGGDFTIEMWAYPVSKLTNFPCLIGNYTSYAAGALSLFAGHNSGNTAKYQVAINGAAFPTIQSSTSIVYNAWVHLAVVRKSGVITLYINGVSEGTYSTTATLNGAGGQLWVGTAGDDIANGYFNGYIDDLRITKGVARYTGTFTPPTSQLQDQ